MDLYKFNKVSLLETKPNIKITDLVIDKPVPILECKLVKSRFGETVLAELEENSVFLPKRVVPLLKDNLHEFIPGKYCLVYQGLKNVNKPTLGTIFKIIDNENWSPSASACK